MATCLYRFTFTSDTNSDLTVDFSSDGGQTYTPYPKHYLKMNPGDSLSVVLQGPVGWTFPSGSVVQNIISRANGSPSKQAYSPFANGAVYLPVAASAGVSSTGGSSTIWTGSVGTVVQNPGKGNRNKFELTIAFAVILSGQTTPEYFADDPEMEVEGTG
jgi:hypothetical protein